MAGRDQWGPGPDREGVRHLFVIGRPRPRSDQVRVLAAALTGDPVEAAESHRETRGVRMADGTGGTLEVRAYANPAAEGVSAAITDAEVVQAIGRARGVNRGAGDPVRVWIMADVVTPLVVAELLDWRDLAPSAVERMACRGIVLASPADASRAYADLFPTIEAAKKAFQRAGLSGREVGDNPLRISLLRRMSPTSPLKFSYRPQGAGQRMQIGWARSDMDPEDVWRWLEDRLGELAAFEPQGPPSAPPRPQPAGASQSKSGSEPREHRRNAAPASAGSGAFGSGGDEHRLGPCRGGAGPDAVPARTPPEGVCRPESLSALSGAAEVSGASPNSCGGATENPAAPLSEGGVGCRIG